jgi:hypothetical protein
VRRGIFRGSWPAALPFTGSHKEHHDQQDPFDVGVQSTPTREVTPRAAGCMPTVERQSRWHNASVFVPFVIFVVFVVNSLERTLLNAFEVTNDGLDACLHGGCIGPCHRFESLAPDRHIPVPVDRYIAPVDDASYLLAWERSAVAPGELRQVRWHIAQMFGQRPAAPRVGSMTAGAVAAEQLASEIVRPRRGLLQPLDIRHEVDDPLADPGVGFEHAKHRTPYRHLGRPVCPKRTSRAHDELADGIARKCAVVASRQEREVGGPRAQFGGNRAATPSIAPMTCGAVELERIASRERVDEDAWSLRRLRSGRH